MSRMPSFEYRNVKNPESLDSGEARDFFTHKLGKTLPMFAVTGAPLGDLNDLPRERMQSIAAGSVDPVVLADNNTETRELLKGVLSLGKNLLRVIGDDNFVALYRSDGDYEHYSPHDKNRCATYIEASRPATTGRSEVGGYDFGMSRHTAAPNNTGTVYAVHITLSGSGYVESSRLKINQEKYKFSRKFTVKRKFKEGDVHIFPIQSNEREDRTGIWGRHNMSASSSNFVTASVGEGGGIRESVEIYLGIASKWS